MSHRSIAVVSLLRILASQCIVWHHFLRYGPLARSIEMQCPAVVAFIANDLRHAVQVFFVLSGALLARTLSARSPAASAWTLWWQRAMRLLPLYWVCLILALLAGALARALAMDIDTPARPTWTAVLSHLLLLHSVLGIESFTVGAWYIGQDLQLAAMALAVWWLHNAMQWRFSACIGLMLVASAAFALVVANDAWGPYFFPAFGLGMLVGCVWHRQDHGQSAGPELSAAWAAALMLGAMAGFASKPGWAVAALAAVALLARWPRHPITRPWLQHLDAQSYALFLSHYPVVLIVGSVSAWLGWLSPGLAALGLMIAWALAISLAAILHWTVERRLPG